MRILARSSGGKAFVSNSASSNNRTRIRILSHTQGSFHSTVLLIVRERERPLESKWKRRNKRSGPAATVGLFVENKMMRGFTKDAGLAKKWVERIGSSSDSVGAARECVTKGGETNSSSAVSVGPGRPRTISRTETPQKEQGVSNQAQILPACLWNSSQLLFSGCYQRWLRRLRWEPGTKKDTGIQKEQN